MAPHCATDFDPLTNANFTSAGNLLFHSLPRELTQVRVPAYRSVLLHMAETDLNGETHFQLLFFSGLADG
jgi:hypothetical protein